MTPWQQAVMVETSQFMPIFLVCLVTYIMEPEYMGPKLEGTTIDQIFLQKIRLKACPHCHEVRTSELQQVLLLPFYLLLPLLAKRSLTLLKYWAAICFMVPLQPCQSQNMIPYQHQHYLGVYEKCKLFSLIPESETLSIGPRNCVLTSPENHQQFSDSQSRLYIRTIQRDLKTANV